MKKFLFISDFDGTVTAQDFFQQIMYRYEHNKIFSNNWKSGFDLLQDVFGDMNLTQAQLDLEIERIPLDPYFLSTVDFIENFGGDFLLLSAGCKYYIQRKLDLVGAENIDIIANDGFYSDGGLRMVKDENNLFYSEKFGIDKVSVVKYFRNEYDIIAYAGDSSVDFDACKSCDIRFAKSKLADILNLFNINHHKFKNFCDIKSILNSKLKHII